MRTLSFESARALAGPLVLLAALAASAAPPAARAKAAAEPPRTLLAVPFAPAGEAPEWAGVAIAEGLTDAVVQANQDNFLTLKQLDSVLRRRDLRLNDPKAPQLGLELARALGATELLTGSALQKDDRISLEGRRLRVADGAQLASATVHGTLAGLPALTLKLAAQLLGAAPAKGPITKDVKALELLARCTIELDRQSLGPRARNALQGAKLDAAERVCQAALQADPRLGMAHAWRGVLLVLRGKNIDGRQKGVDAQGFGRFVPEGTLAEWFGARRGGDQDGARGALQRAVAAHPGFLHAIGYLGEERQDAGDEKGAFEWFDKYLQRAPGHPWATGRAARALARLGKKEEAIALTRAALARSDDPELRIELASRLLDANQDAAAEKVLLAVQESARPERPLAALRLGWLYMRTGRNKEARAQFLRAVRQATRDDEQRTRGIAYADLAMLAGREELFDNAIEALQAASAEGHRSLPCGAPELAKWKGRPEFDKACAEVPAPAIEPDEEVVEVELK